MNDSKKKKLDAIMHALAMLSTEQRAALFEQAVVKDHDIVIRTTLHWEDDRLVESTCVMTREEWSVRNGK